MHIRKGEKEDKDSKMFLIVIAVELYQKCVMGKKEALKLKCEIVASQILQNILKSAYKQC